MGKTKPELTSIVAKDNQLIGQMAKFQLSELRLIAYCLAHYDSRKPENRTVEASVSDLQDLFKMTTKDAYGVIRQAVRAVNRKPIEIETEQTDEEWYIFTGFRYYKKEGRFEFKISPEAQPLLLELGGNFTRYRLADVYQFRAASTWKLYELLKRWLTKKEWAIELDELRLLLGVSGKYPRWSDFEKRIVKPATAEINELSDIQASYEKIKRGRTIARLIFLIDGKNPENEDVIDIRTPEQELSWELKKAGIHKTTAEKYSTLINYTGKTDLILKKLPAIIKRATGKKENEQQYILGAVQAEIGQRDLFAAPKEEEKRREQIIAWLKTLSDEDLKNFAETGNSLAQSELKRRNQN